LATHRKNSVLGPLRTLFDLGAIGGMTDGQLLERFARGDEAAELAFAALIERHGPAVLHTCRSILRDEHEAEDAFQATFLVLVRKARSLWVRDSLGPWLHQVAYRAARCARSAAVRRTAHERRATELATARCDDRVAEDGQELAAAIHEEIERLPERYRGLLVLCDIERQAHEQAARHLGCPVGTVKSRLARGRRLLGDRLKRRGLAVPTALPAAGLLSPSPSLTDSTTRAAMLIAAGRSPAGVASAAVSHVMKGISMGLFMNSVKGIALVAVAGALAGGLAWARLQGPASDQAKPPRAQSPRPAPGGAGPRPRGAEAGNVAGILGKWEVLYLAGMVAGQREGYPTPGIVVPITEEMINLPFLTGNAKDPINYLGGMAYLLDPQMKSGAVDLEGGPGDGKELKGIYRLSGDILTICLGGPDGVRPEDFACDGPSESLVVLRQDRPERTPPPRPGDAPPTPTRPTSTPKRAITIRVVDGEGKPLREAHVLRNHVYRMPGTEQPEIENGDYFTDSEGKVTMSLSGESVDLRLWASRNGHVPMHAMWAKEFQSDGDRIPENFTFNLHPGTTIGGTVVDEGGRPVAGALVHVIDFSAASFHTFDPKKPSPGVRPVRASSLSDGHEPIITDAQGRWRLGNVPADEDLVFETVGPVDSPYGPRPVPVAIRLEASRPGYSSDKFELIDRHLTQDTSLKSLRNLTSKLVLVKE
jgi:RNA polymerase sigma factor (sigma-70 family)